MIGALGQGKDGMSQATIVLKDAWQRMGISLDIVDFFDNGGSGVGVKAKDKILATFRNKRLASKYIKNVSSVYMTPKLSLLGYISCITYFKMCIKHDVPFTLHFHGRAFSKTYNKYPFLRPAIRKYAKLAACNIALTQSLKDEILDSGIGGKWAIVGNYAQDFMMLDVADIEYKKQVYLNKPLKICYLSNIIESKGIFELMEAVSCDERFNLLIAGRIFPDEKIRFDELLARSSNIDYLGFVSGDEKHEMLKSSAIMALPTQYPTEAQPISLIEGICMGCIIIATTHIGIMDTLGKDYPIELFVERDTKDIKDRLNSLYETDCRQGMYVLDNLIKYQKEFSVDKYANAIHDCMAFN